MTLALATALVAGALTVLAPCSLTLLPVILAGSVTSTAAETPATGADRRSSRALHGWRRAAVVTASLAVSVVVFTLALKATTALIGISPAVWRWLSGGLLILLGVLTLAPGIWDRVTTATGVSSAGGTWLHRATQRRGVVGAVLTGAALGPVFTSCSPMFGYVVVTVLPANLAQGLLLLAAYVLGLSAVLFAIALAGQRLIARLRWAADPHGWFRRAIGVLFVVLGVLIGTGLMQRLEVLLLDTLPWLPGASL